MSNLNYTTISKKRILPIAAALSAIPALLFAQENEDSEEEIFVLSPFEVDASDDVGYRAENTLSGSRLNSSLKNVPAVIDVSTAEFIEDLGVTSFQELMEYQGNTQVHDFEDTGAANSGTFNSALPNERSNSRTRGFAGFITRDFIPWNSADDTYNINRYDLSKGPNGVLYGLGSIGATTNATTKRALTNLDSAKVELQVGSWDHMRASIDFNKVLVEDRFALRVNVLEQDSEGYRNFSFKEASRFALAATYRIADRTTLYASFEDGETDQSSQRPFGPVDSFSEWLGEGMLAPTYNNGRANSIVTSGIQHSGGNALLTVVGDGSDNASLYNLVFSPRTTAYDDKSNLDPYRHNYRGRRLYDDAQVYGAYAIPDTVVAEGPDTANHADWDQLLVTLQHSFSDNINMDLTFYKEDLNASGLNPGSSNVYVDLVENFGDSTSNRAFNTVVQANENYGNFYMENVWRTNNVRKDLEGIRATVSYDLDLSEKFDGKLGDILGHHSFAFMLEDREELYTRENTFEVLTTDSKNAVSFPNKNANPEHARNRIWRRNYVSFGEWDTFHTGRFPSDMTVSAPLADGSVASLETAFVPTGKFAIGNDITKDDVWMVATQNFFMNDRIVSTLGYRVDDVVIDSADSVRDTIANTGIEDYDGDGMLNEWTLLEDSRNETDIKAITRTFGLVGHLTEHFSLFANYANGRQLPALNQRIAPIGEVAPGKEGSSEDYGIAFSFLEGKISGRINRFETEEQNRFIFNNSGTTAAANQIMTALQEMNAEGVEDFVTAEEYDFHTPTFNGGLADGTSEGYELRLNGRPTKNIELIFNYSYSTREMSNVLTNNYEWMLGEAEYYEAKLAEKGLDLDSEIISWNNSGELRTTANDALDVVLGNVQRFQTRQRIGFGERKHKANLTAKYSFSEGRMKGFMFGGSARWQGKNVADGIYDFDDNDNDYILDFGEANFDENGLPIVKDIIYGRDTFMADLMMRYRFKTSLFGDNANVDLQLNVKNVFGNTDPLETSFTDSFEGLNQIRYQEPRSYRLTMRLKF